MLIKVKGIGGYTKSFDSKRSNYDGYVSRAHCKSGDSSSSKGWGAGFISLSPSLEIERSVDDPYEITEDIEPQLVDKLYKGEMRATDETLQKYLALYSEVEEDETPDYYLLKIELSDNDGGDIDKIESIDKEKARIISEAGSINNLGTRMDYQVVILVELGTKIKFKSGLTYKVADDGELERIGNGSDSIE